jgi:hypothetical protein
MLLARNCQSGIGQIWGFPDHIVMRFTQYTVNDSQQALADKMPGRDFAKFFGGQIFLGQSGRRRLLNVRG